MHLSLEWLRRIARVRVRLCVSLFPAESLCLGLSKNMQSICTRQAPSTAAGTNIHARTLSHERGATKLNDSALLRMLFDQRDRMIFVICFVGFYANVFIGARVLIGAWMQRCMGSWALRLAGSLKPYRSAV